MNFTRLLQRNVSLELASLRHEGERARSDRERLFQHLNVTAEEVAHLQAEFLVTAEAVNGSLAGLVAQVAAVRVEVAQNHSAQLEQQNRSLAALAATFSGNLDEARAAQEEQGAAAEMALQEGLEGVRLAAEANWSVLRAGLAGAREQLLALEQNTSSSLARSNALLAAAVGEVNQSLSLLGTAAGASFARVEADMATREAVLVAAQNESAAEVAAQVQKHHLHLDLMFGIYYHFS